MCGVCLLLCAPEGTSLRVCCEGDAVPLCTDPISRLPAGCAFDEVRDVVRRRGPDAYGERTVLGGAGVLGGAVLHMRGEGALTPQPYVSPESPAQCLAWNGEVFQGLGITMAASDVNDTAVVYDALLANVGTGQGDRVADRVTDNAVHDTLAAVDGPFAFVFAYAPNVVYFGRDRLGRRSMLFGRSDTGLILTSAVADAQQRGAVVEVPTGGFYRLDWSVDRLSSPAVAKAVVSFIPWRVEPLYKPKAVMASVAVSGADLATDPHLDADVSAYLTALCTAVRKRVVFACKVPEVTVDAVDPELQPTGSRVGVLFSGGVDCAVLAALADEMVPAEESIDLINVSFGTAPDRTPDRISGRQGWRELCERSPTRRWNLIEVNFTRDELLRAAPRLAGLIAPADTVMDVNIAAALWYGARGVGRLVSPDELSRVAASAPPPSLHRAGVSTSQAATPPEPLDEAACFRALTDALRAETSDTMPLISLSDVTKAHRLPYREAGFKKAKDFVANAARRGLVVVQGTGNFLKVGLPEGARCQGDTSSAPATQPVIVRSSARALLVGMGADETLGGYTRYRRAWERGGCVALADEMASDFTRLWRRNLGRDDRVISDHGREARFPFLDEDVLRTLAKLPLASVCDMRAPQGVGEKRILRDIARRLRIPGAAALQKRAIQFGTRLANSKVEGTTVLPMGAVAHALEECLPVADAAAAKRPRAPDDTSSQSRAKVAKTEVPS